MILLQSNKHVCYNLATVDVLYIFYSKHLRRVCLIVKLYLIFSKENIMKKLLAVLIAGTFATAAFAMDSSAPMAQDNSPMMTQDAKAPASSTKKMKKHHHKAKKHAKKAVAASDVK